MLFAVSSNINNTMADVTQTVSRDRTFATDNEHFKAVTSILSLLGRPDEAQYDSTLPRAVSSSFKRIQAASVLLVRTHDVVACLPNHHLELNDFVIFCSRTGDSAAKQKIKRNHYRRQELWISRNPNPGNDDNSAGMPVITILDIPEVDIDPETFSACQFILDDW